MGIKPFRLEKSGRAGSLLTDQGSYYTHAAFPILKQAQVKPAREIPPFRQPRIAGRMTQGSLMCVNEQRGDTRLIRQTNQRENYIGKHPTLDMPRLRGIRQPALGTTHHAMPVLQPFRDNPRHLRVIDNIEKAAKKVVRMEWNN